MPRVQYTTLAELSILKRKGTGMPIDHGTLSRMLETAVVAARLAGQRAMEELNFIKASIKSSDEMVTQADARCQQIIVERIKEAYPDHGFLAEEGVGGKTFKQPPRGADRFWWVIDPIDGTNNFAHRMLFFAVSIAVCYDGEPIVGVIFDPPTDSMFTAVKDGEAQLNGRRIRASEETINRFSSIGLDSHTDSKMADWVYEIMHRTRYRNLGTTALQLAYVAKGSLVATIVSRAKIWDIAAGALITQRAGAVFTDWKGQKVFPVDLEEYEAEDFQVVASNPKIQPELLVLMQSR
jgi:myo-inositol-1(or 4)-monophosphatase